MAFFYTQNGDGSYSPIDPASISLINPATIVYSADGAITTDSQNAIITKGSVAAMTLAAPSTNQNSNEICIINNTAFAHVITLTGLLDDGVTGGSKNTITLGAFVGSSATLVAYNLKWKLKAKTVATIA